MASTFAPWWKRLLHKTFLFKLGPCSNYHWRWHRLCYCRRNEYCGSWNGGIYDFKTGAEI